MDFYDRAGTGGSDAQSEPRSSDTIVLELHALLAKEHVRGPYILVGHSVAGLHMLVFAGRYPRDVGGMVMVDCDHPDDDLRLLDVLGPQQPGEPNDVASFRKMVVADSGWANVESYITTTSWAQARAVRSLGNITLVVLTAGHHGWFPSSYTTALEGVWRGLQEALAGLSEDSLHVLIPESGHSIELEDPAPVILAIQEVLTSVRTNQLTLPACTGTFTKVGGQCFPPL